MGRVDAGLAVAGVVPDPSIERELEPFGATLGLDCLAMVAYRSSSCAHHKASRGRATMIAVSALAGRSLGDGAGITFAP